MIHRPNRSEEREALRQRGSNMFEAAIDWQQQTLKASLISTEMMRIGMHHLERQLEYLTLVSESLNKFGKLNSEFLQHAADDAATDWSKTAEIAAVWTREAGEQPTEKARAKH